MAGRGTGCLLFLTTPISARFTAVDVPLWSAHHVLRPPALKFLPRVLSTSRGCYISFYASDLRPPAERFPGFPHEQGRRRPARRYCGRWARTRTLRALRHRGKTRSKAVDVYFAGLSALESAQRGRAKRSKYRSWRRRTFGVLGWFARSHVYRILSFGVVA